MQAGDAVRVIEGPLAGLSGILKASSDQGVVLALELGGQAVDVEMDPCWVAVTALKRKSASSVTEPEIKRLGLA